MTQNWTSQVVSSLGNGNFRTFLAQKIMDDNLVKLKFFANIINFLFVTFYVKLSCYLQIKIGWYPDTKMCLFFLLGSNMFNGNMETFWQRKLYIKTWYSSKHLRILLIFLMWFFGSKMFWYLKPTCHSLLSALFPRVL